MDYYLNGVIGIVEANSYELHMLWEENERSENPKSWKQDGGGPLVTVGHLDKMPVCISLFIVRVDSHKVLFFDATSQVVDYRLIDNWMEDNLPESARRKDGFINKSDAANFHNIFPRY